MPRTMHDEHEGEAFKKQTYACYAALRSPKVLRVFTEEEGADAHS